MEFYTRTAKMKMKTIGESVRESLLGFNKSDYRLRELMENPDEIPRVETAPVGNNEIMLGCTDDDYLTPVTLPYNGKSFGMLIVAGKGDGKTQLLKHILFSQLHLRFGYNIMICDPKNDYSNLNRPMDEPSLVEKLIRHGIEPRGFPNVKYYKPAFFNMQDRKGEEFIITLRDFDALEYGKRDSAIREFFGIEDGTGAARRLEYILSKRIPKTIKGLEKLLQDARMDELKMREEAGSKSKNVSTQFEVMLAQKRKQGLIGDDGDTITLEVDDIGKAIKTKKVFSAKFPYALEKHRIVVLEVELSAERSRITSSYFKIALANVWQDRKTYIESGGHKGVMSNPTFVAFDEADVLCPSEREKYSPSRSQINEFMRRGRQFGFGVIGITQQPEQISREFVSHCDYILTTRVRSKRLKELIQTKYALDDYLMEGLEKMEYDVNKPYKKWVCLTGNPQNPIIPFVPMPPNCAWKQENE